MWQMPWPGAWLQLRRCSKTRTSSLLHSLMLRGCCSRNSVAVSNEWYLSHLQQMRRTCVDISDTLAPCLWSTVGIAVESRWKALCVNRALRRCFFTEMLCCMESLLHSLMLIGCCSLNSAAVFYSCSMNFFLIQAAFFIHNDWQNGICCICCFLKKEMYYINEKNI